MKGKTTGLAGLAIDRANYQKTSELGDLWFVFHNPSADILISLYLFAWNYRRTYSNIIL
jgi:hypothetical protein